ncbi:protein kinase family protein [Rivularia sp. PCC 7116]|uniref:serine/threonine protein kinase n=1 Tax=Rivularia sp. PCC 7116 TaxID=373994 RepID=UPI00029F2224|nr:serine/threonine-protein kinase [Rivularia sp. PCC 7116]AFY53730.1 protein kinase family protein [Rivularia sp. PCC 7116]
MRNEKQRDFSEEIIKKGYEIQRQLAKKAGRRTLLAKDLNSQELVVIKLLAFGNDFSWEDLKLFEREAQTLQTLQHPAIPSYVNYFELDGKSGKTYALVQSYIEGESLEEVLKAKGKLTESEIINIAKYLLEILTYLHRRQPPLIHRDIKPSNIILAEHPYLVDFGSVQTLASKGGQTVTVVGTYGYMPPEQFGGAATAASDLYSLGATLITLATGIQPADLPQEDMRIAFEKVANLTPSFAEWLGWLIEPSLDKRASSAEVALEALETGKLIKAETEKVIQYKRVGTVKLFWHIMWRSLCVGGGVVITAAAIYGTVFFPIIGTYFGAIFGGFVGVPLSIGNGLLVGIITRVFFYPLKNSFYYRRIAVWLSMSICTAAGVIGFSILNAGTSLFGSKHFQVILFSIFVPAVISGLSMGVATKSFARWYDTQSRRKN